MRFLFIGGSHHGDEIDVPEFYDKEIGYYTLDTIKVPAKEEAKVVPFSKEPLRLTLTTELYRKYHICSHGNHLDFYMAIGYDFVNAVNYIVEKGLI